MIVMAEYLALCNSNFTFRKCFHMFKVCDLAMLEILNQIRQHLEKKISAWYSAEKVVTQCLLFSPLIFGYQKISVYLLSVFAGIISMNSSYQRNFNMLSFQQFNLLFGWTTFFTTCWLLHNESFTNLMNDGSNGDLNCKVLWRNGCVIFEITVSFLSMLL